MQRKGSQVSRGQVMSGPSSTLQSLPSELRDHIYQYVLINEHTFRDWYYHRREPPQHIERIKAYLRPTGAKDGNFPILTSAAAFSCVSKPIRADFSDFLHSVNSDIDIVVEVHNFDFSHVIQYLQTKGRKEAFCVREDGTIHSRLMVKLGGPFDKDWKPNLQHWIDFIESWIGLDEELATAHKTIVEPDAKDPKRKDPWSRAPTELLTGLYRYYQGHRRGAGRLELDRLFYTVYARFGVVAMMIQGRDVNGPYGLRLPDRSWR